MTYKLVQYFVSFLLTLRKKYSLRATAITAFFFIIKQKIFSIVIGTKSFGLFYKSIWYY